MAPTMTRCLRERRLLLIQAGEGTPAEHAHLRLCADCVERYDALFDDLELIGQVLKAPPPRLPAPAGAFSSRVPRLALAGVGVSILAVALIAGGLRRQSSVDVAAGFPSVGRMAEEVSLALLSTDDVMPAAVTGSDGGDVRAALSGRWPCPSADSLGGECDDELSVLSDQSGAVSDFETNG